MEDKRLTVGRRIIDANGISWRIIAIDGFVCRLIRMNVTRREICTMTGQKILGNIANGTFSMPEDQGILVLDRSQLNDMQREVFERRLAFVNDFRKLYAPSYFGYAQRSGKGPYKELYTRHGYHVTTADGIILRWLQSGMQDSSLVDPRFFSDSKPKKKRNYRKKPGRKGRHNWGIPITEEVIEAFDYGVKVYCSGRLMTKREAYLEMISKYYIVSDGTGIHTLPPDERPTERQFLRYLNDMVSTEENEKIKTSLAEYHNNKRLLLGSPRMASMRPGNILEADALEVDIDIVSAGNTQQNISRPVAYMLTDLYSHCVVAVSVGFNNNSMLGLSNLMINLFEDKDELLAARGLDFGVPSKEFWPERFIPNEIRCDRGSDFASDKFSRICEDLNIVRTLEPGATGSMKGLIEQSFRLFHKTFKSRLEHMGVIQKRYDSNHKKEACLTIDDIFSLIVEFVRFHNTNYIKGFRLPKAMRDSNVDKTPISIWNYGIENKGVPMQVSEQNYSVSIFKLLPEATATIARGGIIYRRLFYVPDDDPELVSRMKLATANAKLRTTTGEKINSITVRYDPRSINTLFYVKDGRIMTLSINSAKCEGMCNMTWSKYEEYYAAESEKDSLASEYILQNRIMNAGIVDKVAAGAERQTYASSKGIRDARKQEKEADNFRGRVETRIGRKEKALESDVPEEEDVITITEAEHVPEEPAEGPVGSVNTDEAAADEGANPSIFDEECPPDLLNFLK